MGLILGQKGTIFGTKRRISVSCPGTLWDKNQLVGRLRDFLKSSPVNIYFGLANGFSNAALRSSVTLLKMTYPLVSSDMSRRHASALLEANSMACWMFFSMISGVKCFVQKNEVSISATSSASALTCLCSPAVFGTVVPLC